MIDYELVESLRQEENASKLVNSLILEHYKSPRVMIQESTEEKEILQQVKNRLFAKVQEEKETAEFDKLKEYLADLHDNPDKMAEYIEGVKNKLWKSTTEFAQIKTNAK